MPLPSVLEPVLQKFPVDGVHRGLPWNTLLFNCDCHSFDEVARQLMKAIRVTYERAMSLAQTVHNSGSAVVFTGHRERCEAVAMVLEEIGLRVKVVP